jgi:hypothetical protein
MQNIHVDILFNGRPAKIHSHEGKLYLEGKEESEYSIKLTNNNNYRVLAIFGIDGINTINGNQNTTDSPGFVIERYGNIHLKGYQINDEKCAKFKIVPKNKSYSSEKLSKSAQNGVISVDVYKEYEKPEPVIIKEKEYIWPNRPYKPWPWHPYDDYPTRPWTPYPWDIWYTSTSKTSYNIGLGQDSLGQLRCCNTTSYEKKYENDYESQFLSSNLSNDNVSSSNINVPSDHFSLGSTFGATTDFKVTNVSFEKGEYLGQIAIYYSTRQNLEKMGVKLRAENRIVFPEGTKTQYCSFPKNYTG